MEGLKTVDAESESAERWSYGKAWTKSEVEERGRTGAGAKIK